MDNPNPTTVLAGAYVEVVLDCGPILRLAIPAGVSTAEAEEQLLDALEGTSPFGGEQPDGSHVVIPVQRIALAIFHEGDA